MKFPVRLRFNFRGSQEHDTQATSGAECSEQITRICSIADPPKLDCTTTQIGGS